MNLKQNVDKSFVRSAPDTKVPLGQHIYERISANTTQYPDLPFSIAVLKGANNLLASTTAAAKSGDKTAIASRNNAEKDWNDKYGKTADYVSFLAAGNAVVITEAGFNPTSDQTTPTQQPDAAVLNTMTQHEGGIAEVNMTRPGGSKVAAYMYMAIPADAQVIMAADGTVTITLAGGQKVVLKCDTHSSTTIGGMDAGKMMKMVVQPINNKGAGGLSTPKAFTPQP